MPEYTVGAEITLDLAIIGWMPMNMKRFACRVDPFHGPSQKSNLGMAFHVVDFRVQAIRQGNVIGVHDGNISSLRKDASRVARLRQDAGGYLMELDPVIPGCVARDNGFRIIR
jgi:hypothetical protein